MAIFFGVVVKIHKNGKAEVRIEEQNPGIIGAPDLNVCHSTSPGSMIVTQADNRAGALPGDEVCLEQSFEALFKNFFVLILIPLLSLGTGFFIGAVLYKKRLLPVSGVTFTSIFSLFIGLAIGIYIYKKIFSHLDPVIIKVIKSKNQPDRSRQ